ncbi:MAG: HAMP domain-containing histidine kinase [Gammaproteobacteria bacterium]|nr:HAMP domain-containing histidine kinase [Gammaproteobacteria bacterium]NNJ49385.1 HAMP domain-containing histidine kinase [Gammaproteobacteria bacterium]
MPPNSQFLLDNEHRLLGLMIFSLLAAIHLGNGDTALTQSFLFVHFGFFLLWQPVIKQQSSFSVIQLFILTILIAAYIYFFNPWLNAFWTLLLLTLLTGRIFARGLARAAYGLAVITLFIELILYLTPELFNLTALSSSIQPMFSTALMLLPLLLLLYPVTDSTSNQVDFIRGFLVVILTVFLCMGSVLISLTAEKPYLESLATSAIILSLFLLLTAFLWAPRAGFTGLAQLLEKYVLNIGGPFEQWFTHVSTLEANTGLRPENFLSASLHYLMRQHWICGVRWNTASTDGLEGEESSNQVSINDDKLRLTIYTYTPVGPSLLLHSKLLLNVLTFYYRAKLQEQQMLKQAHMQAIYETGSKLTHDVKNILQSTQTMSQIISDEDATIQERIDVLRKQMPLLTQRLNTTLEKLRAPSPESVRQAQSGSLLHWWNQLQLRYTGRHIEFSIDIDKDMEIPVDIFTTVVENLLDNARNKRLREPKLSIVVQLSCERHQLQLSITDTGSAIEPAIYHQLFKEVVSSNDGFGIGMYQSYELARTHGYELSIGNNEDGEVRFVMKESNQDP